MEKGFLVLIHLILHEDGPFIRYGNFFGTSEVDCVGVGTLAVCLCGGQFLSILLPQSIVDVDVLSCSD